MSNSYEHPGHEFFLAIKELVQRLEDTPHWRIDLYDLKQELQSAVAGYEMEMERQQTPPEDSP